MKPEIPVNVDIPEEYFFRIIELPLKSGDSYRGFQCEKITLVSGTEIKRELIDKPNMFEYAQSRMMDLMDPREQRNEVADASEFV